MTYNLVASKKRQKDKPLEKPVSQVGTQTKPKSEKGSHIFWNDLPKNTTPYLLF